MSDRLLILDAQADLYFGGSGTLCGTVTEKGVPGEYRVRLYAQDTGLLARETWSDPETGYYAFPFLSTTIECFLVAFDHTATIQNAAIRDHVYAATPATVVNLELGEASAAANCPYDLRIAAYSTPGGACPYNLRIGVGDSYTGTLAATLDDAVAALAGATRDPTKGTLTITLAGATPVFNTNVLPPEEVVPDPITATWTATLAGDTPAFVATAHPAGRLIATLHSDSTAAAATYTTLNKAVINATLQDAVVAAQGAHGEPPDVFMQANLASDTFTATGLVVYDITATLDATLDDATASLAAQQPYRAVWDGALEDDVVALFATTVPVVMGAETWRIVDQGALTGDLGGAEEIALTDTGSGTIALTLTSDDALAVADTGNLDAYLPSSDWPAIAESGTVVLRSDAVEWLTVSDEGSVALAITATSADTATLTESSALIAWRITTESVAVTEASNLVAALVSSETASCSDSGGFVVTVSATSADTCGLTDVGVLRPDRAGSETVALADVGSVQSAVFLASSDTLAWSESIAVALDQALLSADTLALLDTGSAVIAVSVAAEEIIAVHEQWGVVGGTLDTGACWVLNADTLAVSRYAGLPFTQVEPFGDQLLAVGPAGLYQMTGDTDAGAAIAAQVETGLQDYGTALLKRMPNATVDYNLASDLQLSLVWVDASGTRQTATYLVDHEQQGVVHLGRGIRFRWRKLILAGAAPWALFRIDEYPEILSRRRGG